MGIIQDVGGYTGEVYAVGSGGMVLAKGNKWKSLFTSLTYHFTGVWCDGTGDCFLTGLGGSPPSSGATLINFKGTGVKNTQSFPSVQQLNAVGGAGGSVAAVGSGCSFKLKQGTGSWGTIQVQGMCSQLKGVWGANANYFYAVGSGGVLVRWMAGTKAYVTGTGGQDLNAVWGAGSKAVWAVGQQGRVVFHDGSGWKDRASGIKGKPHLSDVWGWEPAMSTPWAPTTSRCASSERRHSCMPAISNVLRSRGFPAGSWLAAHAAHAEARAGGGSHEDHRHGVSAPGRCQVQEGRFGGAQGMAMGPPTGDA